MTKFLKNSLLLIFFLGLTSCSKEEKPTVNTENQTSLDLKDYFLVGTIGSSNSVYMIKFLDQGKAIFYNSSSNLVGQYSLEKDLLTFEVKDEANYRLIKCFLDKENQVRFTYYQALKMPYLSDGKLLKIADENQFAGKTFSGTEYRMGTNVQAEKWFYKFDDKGEHYGVGEVSSDITPDREIEFLNNSVFRYKASGITEMGYIDNQTLKVSSVRGLYFSGTYDLVK